MRLSNVWINGDCLKELKKIGGGTVDLIITSPPYHNLRVYSNDPCDLSNCESYEEYYYLLGLVVAECERVLKPGGKFVMQFESYNMTLGRDNKRGRISLTGDINKIFIDNKFTLWDEICWLKYTPQRAMISDGSLWYRNLKARDTITAANFGYVYVYKKQGDCPVIKGGDITLDEWASWASGVWNIPNSTIGGAKHMTPFAYELCRRLIKLFSIPGDTVLDPFAGSGTVNRAAIENGRNAIGIELRNDFYIAAKDIMDKWDESVFNCEDNEEKMIQRFKEQLEIGELGKQKAAEEKQEVKELRDRKKELRIEIKILEEQLKKLNLKKTEIKNIKDSVKEKETAKI